MAQCELIENCFFFNDKMAEMPSTADTYKRVFCLEDCRSCARFMVYSAVGRGHVPADLFPTQVERASSIISEIQK